MNEPTYIGKTNVPATNSSAHINKLTIHKLKENKAADQNK